MSQILATKLFPPFLRPGRVRRERLLSHLNLGIHGKLTLVSAPAGFGKSTLLAEFASQMAEQQGYQTAWLSLDEGDSDVRRFFQYLVAALQTLEKGEVKTFGQDALALVQASPEGMPEQALTQLLNDLYGLQQPTLLVLDDYHLLEGADVNGLLQRLLEHWPGQVHLAIGTREDPALPLARMRARGEVNEVRASDLRFSVEESGQFMAETMKVPLAEAEVEALETRTEGWIAGLQLAGVSLQRSPDRATFLKEFTGSHRFVLDYLTEEVLQTQSDEVRQFLLQASIFERFSAGLCEAVTGLANCGEILRQLEQGNLFLVALDHQGQWFRFHHLFADMLASQRSLSDDKLQGIYARASGWFASQTMTAEAVRYGLLAKDYDSVADLLDLYWDDMWFYSMERDLIGWVEALPESVWQHRPVISGFYAMALLSYDRPKGSQLLRATWEQVQAGGEHLVVRNQQAMATLPGLIAIGEAYLAGSEGDGERVLHWASEALKRLPDGDQKWRGAALALQGTVHWGIGDLDLACESIAGCLRIMDECGDLAGLMSSYYLLAAAKVSQGEIREGRRLIELAFEKLEELKPLQPQGAHEVWTLKAELSLIDGDIEATRKALEITDKMGIATRLPEEAHKASMLHARLAMMHNQPAQALEYFAEAERIRMPSPAPDAWPIDMWRARVWLMTGQVQRAQVWLNEQGLSWNDEASFLRESLHLTHVRCWLQQGSQATSTETAEQRAPGEAVLALLSRLQTLAQSQRRFINQIEIGFLQARVCHQLQQQSEAEQHRRTAQALASSIGHQLWVTQLESLDTPLECNAEKLTPSVSAEASEPQMTNQSEEKNTEAEKVTAPNMNGMAELDEPLSSRELDVLKLLATDLTGPQISDKLFVSLNTFRTHTKNIYAKLEVSNRQSALIKARGLGLI